jgi:hypothetical protein
MKKGWAREEVNSMDLQRSYYRPLSEHTRIKFQRFTGASTRMITLRAAPPNRKAAKIAGKNRAHRAPAVV